MLLLLPSWDDTSNSVLLQKCLNIFTSAVKLYIFMSLMLLVTIYCCSVHVFFPHLALLWWGGVSRQRECADHCIVYKCFVIKLANWMRPISENGLWAERYDLVSLSVALE